MKLVVLGATGNTRLEEFLLASWEGAFLRMKVDRGPLPIRFKNFVFETIFKEKK